MSPMNPRLLRPRASGGAKDADARAYIAAVELADGQKLEPAIVKAIDDFVIGCKADDIWTKLKASCILMGARTLNGILTPLVGTAPTSNAFDGSTDYNRKTGLIGNGSTKYLNANRAGNADGQNDSHIAAYVTTDSSQPGGTFPFYIGIGQGEAGSTHVGRTSTLNNAFLRSRCSTESAISGTTTGLIGISRQLSASFAARRNGTNTTFNVASNGTLSLNHFVFAGNQSGGVNYFSNARMCFYSIGSGIDLALLDSRITSLYNAIGTAI